MERELGQSVVEKRKGAFGWGSRWSKRWRWISKRLQVEGVRIKASQYGMKKKNQGIISKFSKFLFKAWKKVKVEIIMKLSCFKERDGELKRSNWIGEERRFGKEENSE